MCWTALTLQFVTGADEGGSQQPAPQTRHHINYEEMAREEGLPSVGSIVAYKLLEIDAYWSPQVPFSA